MPEKKVFSSFKDHLSKADIFTIVKNLQFFGLEEIRFTGGEPTLRKDLTEIIYSVSNLGLKKIGLTTNAFHLKKLLPELKRTALNSINISLDSLDPATFFTITKSNSLNIVLNNIFKAKELGFTVKINCVVMRGINDQEIDKFIEFSFNYNLEVRFLEVMNIGVVGKNFPKWFYSAKKMIDSVSNKYSFKRISSLPLDSTAKVYEVGFNEELNEKPTENSKSNLDMPKARIGFIASESMPFCGNCTRLRLTPDGRIRSCLFKNDGVEIKGRPLYLYQQLLQKVMDKKPLTRIKSINQPMHVIGG